MITPVVYCSFCGRSEEELRHRPVAGPGNIRICIGCCDDAKAAMTAPGRVEGRDLMSYAELKARNPNVDSAIDLARRRGWAAFINERDRAANPYVTEKLRTEWGRGYDEAEARYHSGQVL